MYDLRDQILSLSSDERANLLALIEHADSKTPFRAERADLELWAALTRLSPVGTAPRSLPSFLETKGGVSKKAWREAIELLSAFAAQVTPVRRRDEDRAAVVDLVLECVAADLQRRGERVSPKTLLEALPHLHSAVDRAYPGYIGAGLLDRLIRLAPPPSETAEAAG